MASTGAFRKGQERREEILTVALEVFAQEGYRGTSLREIAKRSGLSLMGLMHYFDSKEDLLTATLQRRDAEYQELFDQSGDFVEGLVAVMRHNMEVPGQVELNATMAAAARDESHPAHEYFRDRTATISQFLAENIAALQATGEVAPELDPDRLASLMLAVSDGIQLQWMSNPSIDLAEALEYFWQLIRTTDHTAAGHRSI